MASRAGAAWGSSTGASAEPGPRRRAEGHRASLAEDEGFRLRFVRESKAAASIDHPNVIPIYSAGEQDGVLYLAMRYVDGDDLPHADPPRGPARRRAGGLHRLPGRLRAGRRPRRGARAPRRQAGQRPARPRRSRLPHRLRPDQDGRRRVGDPLGPLGRHARLRRAGADPRRAGGCPRRRLRARVRALPRADRPRAVPARRRHGDPVRPHQRPAPVGPRQRALAPGRVRRGARPRAREGPGRALPVGRRPGPRRAGGGRDGALTPATSAASPSAPRRPTAPTSCRR